VIEHNGGNPPSNLVLCSLDSESNFKFIKRYSNIGLHCHNIHWNHKRTRFTTLSSMEFSIKEFNKIDESLVENKRKQIKALGNDKWYLRGLGHIPDFWVIGLSMHQEIKDSDPQKRRNDRRNLQNGGAVILNDNWDIVHEIQIDGRGQIHDLRIIDGVDECHNQIVF
jgi:hypothetical protein